MNSDAKTIIKVAGRNRIKVTIGIILSNNHQNHLSPDLFAVIGVSYDEVALLRLPGSNTIGGQQHGKWHRLLYNIKPTNNICIIENTLYADLSHLIVKTKTTLLTLLLKSPNRIAGTIHKNDIKAILDTIQDSNNISNITKRKYLALE